jgi:hypothetical protein
MIIEPGALLSGRQRAATPELKQGTAVESTPGAIAL